MAVKCEKLGYEFIGWVDGYKNKESKMIIRCGEHGEFYPSPSNFEKDKGGNCSKCIVQRNRQKNPEDEIRSALGDELEFLSWVDGAYVNQQSKFVAKCKKHGKIIKTYVNAVNKGTRCPKCSYEKGLKRKPFDLFVRDVLDHCLATGIKFNGVEGEYVGSKETK